jgi:hypothetical protein
MFSKIGALGTFGALFAAGGKNEIEHLLQSIEHKTTPLIQNTQAEIIGRVLSIALQTIIVTAYGGLLVDILQSGMHSEVLTTRRIFLLLYRIWYCVVMLALCVYNGRLWHTTSLTRRCVYLVASMYSEGKGAYIDEY